MSITASSPPSPAEDSCFGLFDSSDLLSGWSSSAAGASAFGLFGSSDLSSATSSSSSLSSGTRVQLKTDYLQGYVKVCVLEAPH